MCWSVEVVLCSPPGDQYSYAGGYSNTGGGGRAGPTVGASCLESSALLSRPGTTGGKISHSQVRPGPGQRYHKYQPETLNTPLHMSLTLLSLSGGQ